MSFFNFNRAISKKPSKISKEAHTTKLKSNDLSETKKVFDKFDSNRDGRISVEEFKQALKVLSGGPAAPNEAAAKAMFQEVDSNGDGFIYYDEFNKVCFTDGGVKKNEIQEAFRVFDADGNGKISAQELMQVLRRMGERCSLETCKKMIRGVDRDGDGFIDMDEFINMMGQTMQIKSSK